MTHVVFFIICFFIIKNYLSFNEGYRVMREKFKGFYDITADVEKDIFQSNKTLFVLDTNCFLNLYRCEEETKNDFIAVVNNIKDRLWFPFQVCLEYQRNRLGVISSSLNSLDKIKKELKLTTDKINNYCSGAENIKRKYHNLHAELCELKESIDTQIDSFINKNIESRKDKSDFITNSDSIRKWIDSISENKISNAFTQEKINEINEDGDVRYKNKIGPGWKDGKEKVDEEIYFNKVNYKNKYGDLYLWNELLEKAKDENVDNIIFITNDVKEDWWYKVHGKTIGALESLKTEIINAGLKEFKMYTQPSFLIKYTDILKEVNVRETSIKDFESLNKLDFIEYNNEADSPRYPYFIENSSITDEHIMGEKNEDNTIKSWRIIGGRGKNYTNNNFHYINVNDRDDSYYSIFSVEKKINELYKEYDFHQFLLTKAIVDDNPDEVQEIEMNLIKIKSEIEYLKMIKSKLKE